VQPNVFGSSANGSWEPEIRDVEYEGSDEREFKPLWLPGLASVWIIIQAKPN